MEVPVFIRLMQPIMQFVGNLGYVGVAILRGLLATAEPSGLVKVVVNIQYVRNFTQPIQQIAAGGKYAAVDGRSLRARI